MEWEGVKLILKNLICSLKCVQECLFIAGIGRIILHMHVRAHTICIYWQLMDTNIQLGSFDLFSSIFGMHRMHSVAVQVSIYTLNHKSFLETMHKRSNKAKLKTVIVQSKPQPLLSSQTAFLTLEMLLLDSPLSSTQA